MTTDDSKLGPPAALLAGLFGPSATKRVGAAARNAIAAGNWPALRFAAAASDVLGPEQLEKVLRLTAATDPFGAGLASDVGAHLRRLLDGVPGPRRLALLTDLWRRAAEHSADALRRERLRQSQSAADIAELTARYRRLDDDEVLAEAHRHLGKDPSPAALARWCLPDDCWETRARRLLEDALAATVLGRVAEDAATDGLPAALARHLPVLAMVAGMPTAEAIKFANRPVPGMIALPARPAVWVRDIVRQVRQSADLNPKNLAIVAKRVARARDWGVVLLEAVDDFVYESDDAHDDDARHAVAKWGSAPMTEWRSVAGYYSPDRLTSWGYRHHNESPLAERVRTHLDTAAEPAGAEAVAAGVEVVCDLFWLGELGDQVARLHGLAAAQISFFGSRPHIETDVADDPDPLQPPAGPITAAVTAAVQLAELGGAVTAKPRTWPDLIQGLFATAAVAEALTGVFEVPAEIAATDGTSIPGTGLRVEVARTGRQLAAWGAYMGNCIAGDYYVEEAEVGRSVLLALRGPDGRVVLNVELLRRTGGWRIDEIRARFNANPEPDQLSLIKSWAAKLSTRKPSTETDPPRPGVRPKRTVRRPTPAARTLREAGPELRSRLRGTKADLWVRLAAHLPGREAPHTRGPEAATSLRRAAPATLTEVCRRALTSPEKDSPSLAEIWHATGDRPLAAALDGMSDRLAPLALDAPLAGYLRPLARVPEVTAARTIDLVALRVRAAVGRLISADDPGLARHLAARPEAPMLCAMALAATTLFPGGATIPVEDTSEDPWRTARTAAAELGGVPPNGEELRIPPSWMPRGWPALWARASRKTIT